MRTKTESKAKPTKPRSSHVAVRNAARQLGCSRHEVTLKAARGELVLDSTVDNRPVIAQASIDRYLAARAAAA